MSSDVKENIGEVVDNGAAAADEVLLILDGGGTRGVMEAQILEDIMLVLSLLVHNPRELLDALQR